MQTKPAEKNGKKAALKVYEFNGRTGKIYPLKTGAFAVKYYYAGERKETQRATYEKAVTFLQEEFTKLDTDQDNTQTLFPTKTKMRDVCELEQLLACEGGGASLRDTVNYYLMNFKSNKIKPATVSVCVKEFLYHREHTKNVSISQMRNLIKHTSRFEGDFGRRFIHEITCLELTKWLATRTDEREGRGNALWSTKTKNNNLGSLKSLSIFARDKLKALRQNEKTEFEKVDKTLDDLKPDIAIYTPAELRKLLDTAIEKERADMIPILVIGSFLGLRPAEIHGEKIKRGPLYWERFLWQDNLLNVKWGKNRTKGQRYIPLNDAVKAWLAPFRHLKGAIWKYKESHTAKRAVLHEEAGIESVDDGFRHSYASYRIRHLKGRKEELAVEMGNSERMIEEHYKANVKDSEANEWFSIMPPEGYAEKMKTSIERLASFKSEETNK
ncbi:MAG: hypothetical protein WCH57_06160 [Verrucomicrobiota bacterium]